MNGEIGTSGTTEVSAVWDAAPVVGRRRAIGQRDGAGERASRETRDAELRGKLRGSRVGMRRDALFRRTLLVADMLAIVGAFVLTVAALRAVAAADVGAHRGRADPAGGREAHRPLRPRRDAAAQDDARRGAQALPAGDALRAGRLAGGRAVVNGTLDRHEALFLWLALARAAGPGTRGRAGARAARSRRPSAACSSATSVRGKTIRSKLTATAASRPRSSPTSTSTRSRPGRPTRSRRTGSWRSATSPRRWTCTARSSRRAAPTRGEMLEPRAHAEGGRRARQRAAAAARGRGLLGRVRRPARRDRDGRQALRPDALLGGVQARRSTSSAPRSGCSRSRRC